VQNEPASAQKDKSTEMPSGYCFRKDEVIRRKNWEIRELRKLGKLGKLRKSGKEIYYFRLKMMTGPHL
jgi:hypothetical protein